MNGRAAVPARAWGTERGSPAVCARWRLAAPRTYRGPEADLRRIPVPTLLIVGEVGRHVSLDQVLMMRRLIPQAEILILNHAGLDDGANHVVQFTRAEVVGPVALDFLGRHVGEAAAGS